MLAPDLVLFVLRWGVVGSVALTAYLVIAWQAGLLYAVRDESGTLQPRPAAAIVTGVGSVLLFVALLIVGDVRGLLWTGMDLPFGRLFALNYLVVVSWLLYDTFVIDILLVLVWHPTFLRLPDREAHGSVAYHLRTIPRGLILGAVISGVATGVVWLFLR